METDRTRFHMKINAALHRKAKALAAANALTLGQFMELALQAYIDEDHITESPDLIVDEWGDE